MHIGCRLCLRMVVVILLLYDNVPSVDVAFPSHSNITRMEKCNLTMENGGRLLEFYQSLCLAGNFTSQSEYNKLYARRRANYDCRARNVLAVRVTVLPQGFSFSALAYVVHRGGRLHVRLLSADEFGHLVSLTESQRFTLGASSNYFSSDKFSEGMEFIRFLKLADALSVILLDTRTISYVINQYSLLWLRDHTTGTSRLRIRLDGSYTIPRHIIDPSRFRALPFMYNHTIVFEAFASAAGCEYQTFVMQQVVEGKFVEPDIRHGSCLLCESRFDSMWLFDTNATLNKWSQKLQMPIMSNPNGYHRRYAFPFIARAKRLDFRNTQAFFTHVLPLFAAFLAGIFGAIILFDLFFKRAKNTRRLYKRLVAIRRVFEEVEAELRTASSARYTNTNTTTTETMTEVTERDENSARFAVSTAI